jgi:hypothetical protein
MTRSKKSYEAEYREITIRTIDGSTVHGQVNILPDERVSDLLKRQESFIVVVNANHMDAKDKTLFINKNHIVWIEPED